MKYKVILICLIILTLVTINFVQYTSNKKYIGYLSEQLYYDVRSLRSTIQANLSEYEKILENEQISLYQLEVIFSQMRTVTSGFHTLHFYAAVFRNRENLSSNLISDETNNFFRQLTTRIMQNDSYKAWLEVFDDHLNEQFHEMDARYFKRGIKNNYWLNLYNDLNKHNFKMSNE